MSKYYRVRTQEQWDWLKEELNICPNIKPCFPVIIYQRESGEAGIYIGTETELIIEVSDLMEDEKMKDYVTIHSEDLEKIKVDYGQMNDVSLINHDVDGKMYIHERFLPADLMVPKSLLYPKIQFTEAEKKEFDSIDNDETLYNALYIIEREDYPHLYKRIYEHAIMSIPKFELEFARALADPSLIEVIPDRKRKVKVPRSDESYYFKDKIDGKAYLTTVSVDPKNANGALFTDEELKQFGLDDNLFEKVEVQE